jgi:hypothetical protein
MGARQLLNHEKADPCQEFFALYMIFSLFPFSQAASIDAVILATRTGIAEDK